MTEDFERRVESMFETLNGSVNGLQGTVNGLQGTVNGLQGTVGSLVGTVNGLVVTVNRLEVLQEHQRSEMQFLAEGQGGIQAKLDVVIVDVGTIKTDVSLLKSGVSSLDGRVSRIEDHLEIGGPSSPPTTRRKRSRKQ